MAELGRIQTVFTGVAGTPWYNSLYFAGGVSLSPLSGPAVATFWDACASSMVNDVSWTVDPIVDIIDSDTGQVVDQGNWAGDSGIGVSTAEPLPWANQAVINWRTGFYFAGRELRGKTFVPALEQNANNSGVLLGTTVTDLLNAANGLISDPSGTLQVFGRTHFTTAPVLSAGVPTKIGVLRSRRD